MKRHFAGFSKDALLFLQALEKNNKRDWFQPRKEEFEQKLKLPMFELVEELNRHLAGFAPQYVTDPKKGIFRIYRDTRFSADKTPYKTHVSAAFHHRELADVGGAALYFSVNHKQLAIGGGVYHPDSQTLAAIRSHLGENYAELNKLLANRRLKRLLGDLRGEELNRMPKGFPADHPAANLVRKKSYVLMSELPGEVAAGTRLWKELASRFETLTPMLDFFNAALLKRKTKSAKTYLP